MALASKAQSDATAHIPPGDLRARRGTRVLPEEEKLGFESMYRGILEAS
jgi:hypothetical protein